MFVSVKSCLSYNDYNLVAEESEMSKKIAIMQPYFFPYIGYWQLINSVDTFVLYDNIQFTKKGWINKNRYLENGKDKLFSICIEKDNHLLNVIDRVISPEFNKKKLLSQLQNAYAKAPYKKDVLPFLEEVINFESTNLFDYIHNSIVKTMEYLDIKTQMIISSHIDCNHDLKSSDRVIDICRSVNASDYINPIGGVELYDKQDFKTHGINLYFLKTNDIKYRQFNNEFIPNLSIIDVLMFNSPENIKEMLNQYVLI